MSYRLPPLVLPNTPARPPIEWEEVNCLLCRGNETAPLIEAPDNLGTPLALRFAVVQCQHCGLCYTNPRPSPACIGRFYPDIYRPHRMPRPKRRASRPVRSKAWHCPSSERATIPWHGKGRLLDFGCGGGSFLARMNQQGWHVTGIDVSQAAVHRIRTGLGLRALVGTLPHPNLVPESYDLLTMWHSLEHLHDPLTTLQEAHKLLVPGGKLLVAVPNIDSLSFRWFGAAWYGLDLPRHLTHFTPYTLHQMLQRAGFTVTDVRMVRHASWLRASARLATRGNPKTIGSRVLKNRLVASAVSWYSRFTDQLDCVIASAER